MVTLLARSLVGAANGEAGGGARAWPALSKGRYPWYDPSSRSFRPVWPPGVGFFEWLERNLSWVFPSRSTRTKSWLTVDDLLLVLMGIAATVLVVVLAVAWRRQRQAGTESRGTTTAVGHARQERSGLPAGVEAGSSDPWAEASRRRELGDYEGAVIALFAFELLTLERLRLVRLIPGRTGRQLVRAVDDRQYRGWVEPALGLFEAVYYGHRAPTAEAFEAVWAQAESFRARAAEGVRP